MDGKATESCQSSRASKRGASPVSYRGSSGGTKRSTSSLIDDVKIYDRALSPSIIAAHAEGDFDFTVPLTAETSSLDFQIDPIAKTAMVLLDVSSAGIEDSRMQARCAIVPQGQETT